MNLWERQTKLFEESKITDVYIYNFTYEMKQITKLIEEGFNYVGFDTEFPGIIYFPKFEEKYKTFFEESIRNNSDIIKNYSYDTIKLNVDNLKPIQMGFCLFNQTKNEKRIWQFNLKFDILEEKYSNSSIELLHNSGINFSKISKDGIDYSFFSEVVLQSNIIFNKKITWITFHGIYDLAYFIKLLNNNEKLPDEENEFLDIIHLFFPNFYDVKFLLRNSFYKNFGLKKIYKILNFNTNYFCHLAGYDSLVTIEVFFNLIQRNFLKDCYLKENKNLLWGLGEDFDCSKLMEYLLKNQTFYDYYYTNHYYHIIKGYMKNNFENSQIKYITEKKQKNNKNYGYI